MDQLPGIVLVLSRIGNNIWFHDITERIVGSLYDVEN